MTGSQCFQYCSVIVLSVLYSGISEYLSLSSPDSDYIGAIGGPALVRAGGTLESRLGDRGPGGGHQSLVTTSDVLRSQDNMRGVANLIRLSGY